MADNTIFGVAYGNATITEVIQPGWLPTNHIGGATSIYLLNGDNLNGLDFGNREPQEAVIRGLAFNDRNKNGLRDVGEPDSAGSLSISTPTTMEHSMPENPPQSLLPTSITRLPSTKPEHTPSLISQRHLPRPEIVPRF